MPHAAMTFVAYCLNLQSALGITASALVLATFATTAMRPLRLAAISSNVAFIFYALMANLWPIFVLHSILLPLNCFRLIETERRRASARSGCEDGS